MSHWLYHLKHKGLQGSYLGQYSRGARIMTIAEEETERLPAFASRFPNTEGIPRIACCKALYFDNQQRICYQIRDALQHTDELVDRAVAVYVAGVGLYPQEIVLCPSRYFNARLRYYQVTNAPRIPYHFDALSDFSFDVLVRSA